MPGSSIQHLPFGFIWIIIEPPRQAFLCIKNYLNFITTKDETSLHLTLDSDFNILHMKFYMVLIEDAFQLMLGTSYLADASRWYTAHQVY